METEGYKIIKSEDGQEIAIVLGGNLNKQYNVERCNCPNLDEVRANSVLMGSAPELYRACEHALAMAEADSLDKLDIDQLRSALTSAAGLL